MTGVVKQFNRVRGFGFIVPDDDSVVSGAPQPDIFVHYSAIEGEGYRNLEARDRVSFDVVRKSDGNVMAVKVKRMR